MTRKQISSSSLSMSILAACLLGAAGCSSATEIPEVVVVEPWSKAYAGAGTSAQITSITAGASGNVALAGTFTGSMDLGGGKLDSTAEPNLFLAKLDTAGQHVWSGRTGGGDDFVSGIGLDRGGSALAGGTFNGFVDFGSGGELNGAGDIFLARFGAGGDPLWSRRFGGATSTDNLTDVEVDREGSVYLLGSAQGDIDFGLGSILPGQWANLFVAKLNSAGGTVFSIGLETFDYCNGRRIVADSEGNSIVSGEFYGQVNFGGGPISSQNGSGIFLLKLDQNGRHVWSKGFTAQNGPEGWGNVNINDLAVDPAGDVVLAGSFAGVLDFGGSSLDSGDNYNHIFLAKIGADGAHRWSKSFGGTDFGYQQIAGVAVDANSDVHMAGVFESSIDFGGGPLATNGQDIFLVKLDPSGAHLSSKGFGDGSFQNVSAFDVTTGGNPILAGSFSGELDFGSTKLTAAPDSSQIFVAALAP